MAREMVFSGYVGVKAEVGWVKHVHRESGCDFFVNDLTGLSQWEAPGAGVALVVTEGDEDGEEEDDSFLKERHAAAHFEEYSAVDEEHRDEDRRGATEDLAHGWSRVKDAASGGRQRPTTVSIWNFRFEF